MVTKFSGKFAIIMLKKHKKICRCGLTHLDATPIFKNRPNTYGAPCKCAFILRFFTSKINQSMSLQIFIKHYFLAETTHDLHLRRMSFGKRNQASGRNPMSRMRLPYYVQEKNKEVDCFWCQIVKSKMCKRNKQKEYFLPIAKDYGFVNLLVEAKVGSILVFHTN